MGSTTSSRITTLILSAPSTRIYRICGKMSMLSSRYACPFLPIICLPLPIISLPTSVLFRLCDPLPLRHNKKTPR